MQRGVGMSSAAVLVESYAGYCSDVVEGPK